MKLKKKYRFLLIILIFLIIVMFVIKISNKPIILPDNYKLWYEKKEIVLGKQTEKYTFILIKNNIKRISFNNKYIIVEQLIKNQKKYYLIDVRKNKYVDNYTEKEINNQIKKLKIHNIHWYDVKKCVKRE